jgi:hypothetical protein
VQNPIKRIVQFNHDADLVKSGYSDFLESSFQIEEALEGFNLGDYYSNPKEASRQIVSSFTFEGTDVDRLDKACDAVVFAIGSMTKLGLNAQQITQALNIVMDSNQAKLKCPKDSHGKLTKNADFVGPEPRLLELLDSRN